MALNKLFKKEKDEFWVEVPQGENEPNARFKVALMGASNKKYTALASAMQKKHRRTIKFMSDEKGNELAVELFVKTVLLNWENVTEYRTDKPKGLMAFNEENATFLLTDLPDLHNLLAAEATELANFINQEAEEVSKNFPSSSNAS